MSIGQVAKTIVYLVAKAGLDGIEIGCARDTEADVRVWCEIVEDVNAKITMLKQKLLEQEGRSLPEEGWTRADSTRVSAALGSFGGLPSGLVVSDNPDKRSLYQVDAIGLNVKLVDKAGAPILDVVIGKNGPDMMSTYIRRSSEDKVYLVRRPLMGAFSPVAKDWYSRNEEH